MIRAHVEHLGAILYCAIVGTLLGVIVLAELLAGGRGNGPLAVILALAAGASLTGVPYYVCRWWHFTTTGSDDWMVNSAHHGHARGQGAGSGQTSPTPSRLDPTGAATASTSGRTVAA